MRSEVLDYIKGLNLQSYNVSDEIPRTESGISLYLKNPRRIYVDTTEYDEIPLIRTLGSVDVHTYTQTVTILFSTDAKNLPSNYDALVGQLISAKDVNTTEGFNGREASVTTTTEEDLLVTQIQIGFTKIR